jgi:uncharacterized RDD family membrane protein YckC
MNNQFSTVMSQKSDEQLIKIVTVERSKFNPIAIEAAEIEIEKRKINPIEIQQVKEKAKEEVEQIKEVKINEVGSSIRFLNFIIDMLAISIIHFIIFNIINTSSQKIYLTVSILIIFLYYFAMEIKFQKTVGKFITRTKVVNVNGNKPIAIDIFSRTIYRFIPFDRLSYLFVKHGFHDYLSRTRVIKDN